MSKLNTNHMAVAGRPLPENGRFTVSGAGNTLWISHIEVGDRGLYECRAANDARAAGATAQLLVRQQRKSAACRASDVTSLS